MTDFNAYFPLLKVKVDIPNQKVIGYVIHFGLYRKTLSLIGSLCLCVMVIPLKATGSTPLSYIVGGDPESGIDHSLKEVSAYIIWYRVHTLDLQGKCHRLFSVLLFTNNIHVYLQIIYMYIYK